MRSLAFGCLNLTGIRLVSGYSLPRHCARHSIRNPSVIPQRYQRLFATRTSLRLESRPTPEQQWTTPNVETLEEEKNLVESVRSEIWAGTNGDKRGRNEQQQQAKRQKLEQGEEISTPIYATNFSQEEVENESRRPKKKVAVLLGYSGTGYHGMQLSATEKTIEGELFPAFVAAGAISKANAADPKKSSLVRCARTDKGVHAAGNVVSLKLIVDDPDLVAKINEKLSPQIRIWDIQVTNKSFSCYQLCDSRVYEYLIPSHCFVPPHPSTYLGRKLVEHAEQQGDLDTFKARQEEVATYWDDVDERYVKPILEKVPEDTRRIVQKALFLDEDQNAEFTTAEPQEAKGNKTEKQKEKNDENTQAEATTEQPTDNSTTTKPDAATETANNPNPNPNTNNSKADLKADLLRYPHVLETVKAIKAAYLAAKRAYRIPPARMNRIQEALDKYVGTRNFYNYTIQKQHKDPSAKRHIKSFKMDPTPIIINGTEWLSLKVHGQSFMMHQIRKMVAMAALVVRCGCDPQRIVDTYGPTKIAIPKAPGLGLLLERPVFDSYNRKAVTLQKESIDFDKYAKEMNEFKQREIYDRIFREEEETNSFGLFFNHIDHFSRNDFLYTTSAGMSVARSTAPQPTTLSGDQRQALATVEEESEEEEEKAGEEGG